MAKLCKRMAAITAKAEANKVYGALDALNLIKETAVAKFFTGSPSFDERLNPKDSLHG